ncbi:hypothetical protein [Streptomyces violens]|uniref:hypothetical protein n=1 Tax=Streptomyces violens TaxID=66377 RepID=UPI001FDF5334|nr:hypothetical protein [Streptomyces violens]
MGILRRRLVGRNAETCDEAFTRNLRWEPADYLGGSGHVRITEAEAAAFIEQMSQGYA